ncbi:hypothetical protein COV13_03625 [Candidatus Woesearchaeota archaeon CG10_big_fil_rev_8_21_14_0_10_32_9]|nr:MAG: hypothetical protein COV13_03625 [Candidatus Woesearchaeota archaeon CG10_big_fil_rev_8_21_14_0_10_32_9]
MALEKQVNQILSQFPRSRINSNNGLFVKKFLDSWSENLNVLGGKKILTPKQRFVNEIKKRKDLPKYLVSQLVTNNAEKWVLYLENLEGNNLAENYNSFSYGERNTYNREMFSILKEMHENGITDGDAQLRNFVFTSNEKNKSIKKTDLEAEWLYEKEGTLLDLLQLSSDIYAQTNKAERDADRIIYAIEDAYGPIQKMPIPSYMRTYFKTGWKIPEEFIQFLEK